MIWDAFMGGLRMYKIKKWLMRKLSMGTYALFKKKGTCDAGV